MIAFLLALISLAGAWAGVYALLAGSYGPALMAHGLTAAAGYAAARRCAREDCPAGWHEAVWAACVPCVGGVLAWMNLAAQSAAESEQIVDEYARYLDADVRLGAELPAGGERWTPRPDHLESMADILRSEASVEDKRLAIEALARMETPRAVYVLNEALSSPSTEVRFYAASVLGNLEERLGERLHALEQDVTLGLRNDPEVEYDLAQSYFDYAYYGLAEGARREHMLTLALEHIRLSREGRDGAASLLLEGRILLALERYRESEETFSEYIHAHRHDGRGFLWRAEARFRRGDYPGVRRDCAAAVERRVAPPVLHPTLEMWAPLAME